MTLIKVRVAEANKNDMDINKYVSMIRIICFLRLLDQFNSVLGRIYVFLLKINQGLEYNIFHINIISIGGNMKRI